ncbi:MAG: metallophosphoesterase family protein [Nanopusillaceae archaeon]
MKGVTEKIDIEEYKQSIKNYLSNLKSGGNFEIRKNLVEIKSKGEILIIGDLHGDISALDTILSNVKINDFLANKENILISLGDLIDRGKNGVEVIYKLTNLGNNYLGQVIILRGNHEVSRPYEVFPFNFDEELLEKYGEQGKNLLEFTIENFFKKLPLAAYIPKEIFIVHGGIPIQVPSLKEIEEIDPDSSIGFQLRWNDPRDNIEDYAPSDRGHNIYYFGPKITEEFLKKNNLEIIIRSHEKPDIKGYKINHNNKIITIFSAKNVYNLPKASYAIYIPNKKILKIKTF